MKITNVDIDALIPYARNSREHTEDQIAQIAASIREFGFTNPVLIDQDEGIIAGHGRVLAARKLNMDKVPCIKLAHLTEAQKRAYIIADNRLSDLSTFNEDMLRIELADLNGLDFDLSLLGFDGGELDRLLMDQSEGETDPYEEWDGMPEYEQEDSDAYRSLYVHFADEDAVQDFQKIIGQKLTEKTKYIWHPAQVKEDLKKYRCVDES